jgi:pyruvate dehydrogenase E1 component alpha subunit
MSTTSYSSPFCPATEDPSSISWNLLHECKERFSYATAELLRELGKEKLLHILSQMIQIRHFELRAKSAYQQGKIGGFFHSYAGQEAIQTAAVHAVGLENWYTTTYRCHALALLLGASSNELMAELYGKITGNAKGRGGSMHFFTSRLLGGHGIVGGQIPIATGAALSSKYLGKKDEVSLCFLGDGAVAQGSFHESLNIASIWKLPCIYVIENNQWGMGTSVHRAISVAPIAEKKAPSYGMKGYTIDGTNFLECYQAFKSIAAEVRETQTPVLIEAMTERFEGHSISDPGLYRSKDQLKQCLQRDPIAQLRSLLEEYQLINEDIYTQIETQRRDEAIAAMAYADASPLPDLLTLGQDVLAP